MISADWYAVVWTVGALMTWISLNHDDGQSSRWSPRVYALVIALWPVVWTVGAVVGLAKLLGRLVAGKDG